MVHTETFATINVEQLVTATDRLLFGTLKRYEPKLFAHGTSPNIAIEAPTVVMREQPAAPYRSSVVILGVAAAITWLAVVFICLLA